MQGHGGTPVEKMMEARRRPVRTIKPPCGATPVVVDSGDRFGVNMISAVSARGDMFFRCFEGMMDSVRFIEFLNDLRTDSGRRILVIVDGGTGELVGQGVRHFMEFEEVDATRFVKLYLAGMKQAAGLTKAGLAVFEIVYQMLQERPNKDEVNLSFAIARRMTLDLNERTYRRGMRELIEREFLFESLADGLYYVNIRYMFNGDRLTFVKGYKLKGANISSLQAELPLEELPALPAPPEE